MRIEHIALWTSDLDALRDFYVRWFGAAAGKRYHNPNHQFASYFLTFESGARLELMHRPALQPRTDDVLTPSRGLVHLAISVGSRERVDSLTADLRSAGIQVIGNPRQTGDGYYESTIYDPDGNIIEITV